MTEKKLPGLSRYSFRSDGAVVSYWARAPKVIKGGTDKDGYVKFVLINDDGARIYGRRASLICTAFHGQRPAGMEVRHLDGTRDNDAPSNLAWSTHRENVADKVRHGTHQRGEINGNSKMTADQVRLIKIRLRSGESVRAMAREMGIPYSAIYNVKYGKSWTWMDDAGDLFIKGEAA